MFTVFVSADNVVPGYNPSTYLYNCYPSFEGFTAWYSNVLKGRVVFASDMMVGLDDVEQDDLFSGDFEKTWYDGHLFYDQLVEQHVIRSQQQLISYDVPQGTPLKWITRLDSRDIASYISVPSYTFHFSNFIINKKNFGYFTPSFIIRCDQENLAAGSEIDYDIYYELDYLAFNNVTGAAYEDTLSVLRGPSDYRKLKDSEYTSFNFFPYDHLIDFFEVNSGIDALYVNRLDVQFVARSSVPEDSLDVTNMNFSNFLISKDDTYLYNQDILSFYNNSIDIETFTERSLTDWLSNSLGSIMGFEIFPGLSFQLLLTVLVGSVMFFFFLRMFAGG